jgi:hypothetical protein
MSRLEIEWPDEGVERVRAARGRLAQSAGILRALSFEERLAAVARVLGDWTAADSPWRRQLIESLAAETPFELGTVAEGLESALRAWEPETLIQCARRELVGGGRVLAPFEWTTVLSGGSIPMPTILSSLLPLVLGSPVMLRETSKDPVTAGLLARSLAARDERLARCFEFLTFSVDDRPAFEAALEAPCVVATGSDETIRSIAGRLRAAQRFVAYGHRFSVALLGPRVAVDPDLCREVAAGLALDVARWDQAGCLSPVVVYLVGLESRDAERIALAISQALEAIAPAMPRGPIDPVVATQIATERAEARMREASGRGRLFEGSNHTLVLEADAQPRPAPLQRFLRLMPVDSREALAHALAPFAGHLSNVSIAGLLSEESSEVEHLGSDDLMLLESLSRLGVSRVTRPGRMQTPPVDWPHDGMPLFTPMTRFTQANLIRL